MNIPIRDITLASLLICNGFEPISTVVDESRAITVTFGEEAQEFVNEWDYRPTEEMVLIKKFANEREKLFRERRNKTPWGSGRSR